MLLSQHRAVCLRQTLSASVPPSGRTAAWANAWLYFADEYARMSSYRCSIKENISRGKGRSVVNSAAYIGRVKLLDERLGQTFDYSRHPDQALFVGIYAPKETPEWAKDLEQFVNHIEAAEKRKDAQLARPMELNLPCELSLEQNRRLLQDYIRENFVRKGYGVMAAIHAPGKDSDERNIHAHLLITLRELGADGFAKTKQQEQANYLNRGAYADDLRASWAQLGTRHLKRAGLEIEAERWRHGDETLEVQRARALERGDLEFAERCNHEAGKHMGPEAMAMERDGRASRRGDENRAIEARNKSRYAELQLLAAQLAEGERMIAELEKAARREASREAAFWQIKAAAARSETALDFMVNLGEAGLHLARSERGQFVAVDEHGDVHSLNRPLGREAAAWQRDIAGLGQTHAQLIIPTIAELRQDMRTSRAEARAEREAAYQERRAERNRAWRAEQAAKRAAFEQQSIEGVRVNSTEISGTQGDIRLAYRLTQSGAGFTEAVEDRGMMLLEVSAADASRSQKDHDAAKRDPASKHVLPILKEHELVVMNDWGHIYRLTQRTTGDTRAEIEAYLRSVDRSELLSVAAGREVAEAVRAQRQGEWSAERAAEWEQRRAEQRAEYVERQSALLAGKSTVKDIGRAYAESATGPELAALLEEQRVIVCRVSERDAERSRTQRDYLHTTPVYEAGGYVAINERGGVYRLDGTTIYAPESEIADKLKQLDGTAVLSLAQGMQLSAYQRIAPNPERSVRPVARHVAKGAKHAAHGIGRALDSVLRFVSAFDTVFLGIFEFFIGRPGAPAPERDEREAAPAFPSRQEPFPMKPEDKQRIVRDAVANPRDHGAMQEAQKHPQLDAQLDALVRRNREANERARRERDKRIDQELHHPPRPGTRER